MRERRWSGETIDEMTAQLIGEAFHACDGNIVKTARAVGMSRANMYRKLKEYGIYPKRKGPKRGDSDERPLTQVKRDTSDDFRSE